MAYTLEYPDFDPMTETRYSTNGVPAEKRATNLGLAAYLAEHADLTPPTQERSDHLAVACHLAEVDNPGKEVRLAYTYSCHARYDRGIGICAATLRALRIDSRTAIESVPRGILPQGIVDSFGQVDTRRLEDALPEAVKRSWPRKSSGELRTDSKSLEQIDNTFSQVLLAEKCAQRDWALRNIPVDPDGRHPSWANPFGTKTGRDKPMGCSFARLSRDQRVILVPADDHVLVTIDYQQQEPAIALHFARDEELLQAYLAADLYSHVAAMLPGYLSREVAKKLLISFLYGATASTLMCKLDMCPGVAAECIAALNHIFAPYRSWSTHFLQEAYRTGNVTSLDWRMTVHSGTRTATVRNWPIQAAGADILRRVCLKLDEADIPVVGCLHDSVMIEIPLPDYDLTIGRAQSLMADASAEVLDGFRLKSTVENIVFPSGITAGGRAHG